MLHQRSPHRRAVPGLVAAGAGVALVAAALPAAAGTDDGPDHVEGNPTCADLGYEAGFKIEGTGELPADATYTVGDGGTEAEGDVGAFEVTVSFTAGDPAAVDFNANHAVEAVVVKAGPGAYVHDLDPAAAAATALTSPKDSVSHVTFCWNGDGPDDEGPGDDGQTTTTVPATTTTVPATTGDEAEDVAGAAPAVTGAPDFTG